MDFKSGNSKRKLLSLYLSQLF